MFKPDKLHAGDVWAHVCCLLQGTHQQTLQGKFLLQVNEVVNIAAAIKDRSGPKCYISLQLQLRHKPATNRGRQMLLQLTGVSVASTVCQSVLSTPSQANQQARRLHLAHTAQQLLLPQLDRTLCCLFSAAAAGCRYQEQAGPHRCLKLQLTDGKLAAQSRLVN